MIDMPVDMTVVMIMLMTMKWDEFG